MVVLLNKGSNIGGVPSSLVIGFLNTSQELHYFLLPQKDSF
jgi:hypothetical protein